MVVAPISAMPLIPIMSNTWGWQLAGVFNVIGWTLGSIIVFWLCRKYGVRIISKLVSLRSIQSLEKKMPEENMFYTALLLRTIIPADILSYVLGLFSKIRFWPFVISTFIGVIPAAFLLSYVGAMDYFYQIIVFLIIGIIFLSVCIIREIRPRQKNRDSLNF